MVIARRRRLPAAALLAGVLTCAAVPAITSAPPARGAEPTLRAGVGVGDITPPVGTPQFAYTAREAVASGVIPFVEQIATNSDPNLYGKTFVKSEGVHTRVLSRAIVLQSGTTKLALVQVDLGGIPYDMHQAVQQRIAPTGIDRDHLLISVTHTHGSVGPIWPANNLGYAVLGGDLFDPRIFALVADGIAASVLQADRSLAPAKAGVAQVTALDASSNRNLGPHRLNRDEAHSGRAADDKPHSVDPTYTALRVDTAAGRPLGLWGNFALHGTTFGDEMLAFTGDNQGDAERIVEAEIRRRGRVPADAAVVHALANGSEGDISPRGAPTRIGEQPGALPLVGDDKTLPPALEYVVGDFAEAELTGQRVARAALAAWEVAGRRLVDSLPLDARFTHQYYDGTVVNGEPVGPTAELGCGGVACPDGTKAPVDRPGQGAKVSLAVGTGGTLVSANAPLQVLRVGDLLIAGAPYEVTKQMGTRILKAVRGAATAGGLQPRSVVLAGLANGYLSYLATPEEYDAYHYEGSFTLFGRQQGPYVQQGLTALSTALARGEPAPTAVEPPPLVLESDNTPPVVPEPPGAGTPVEQPVSIARFAQARFVWAGGDPAADDPHIRIQRRTAGGFATVTTDDSYEDLVTYRKTAVVTGHEWTDVWEPTVCTPTGSYRFVVEGRTAAGPYAVTSREFAVKAAAAPTPGPVTRTATGAAFSATYPAPPAETLRVRPRFASGGSARISVRTPGGSVRTLRATYAPDRLRYEAVGSVPAGSVLSVVPGSLVDGCGNGAAPTRAAPVRDVDGDASAGAGDSGGGGALPATGLPASLGLVALGAAGIGLLLRRRASDARSR